MDTVVSVAKAPAGTCTDTPSFVATGPPSAPTWAVPGTAATSSDEPPEHATSAAAIMATQHC